MQEIIPMFDDFLDTIWDFDESWYNGRKSDEEARNADLQGKTMG